MAPSPRPIVAVEREALETPPDQELKIQQSLLLGPRKAIRPRGLIIKSKVERLDDIQPEDGNYVVVKSNGMLKSKQNISKIQESKPIAFANGSAKVLTSCTTGRATGVARPIQVSQSNQKISKLSSATTAGPSKTATTAGPSKAATLTTLPSKTAASTKAATSMKPVERIARRPVSPTEAQKRPLDKGKTYDPARIKSYMEQQREVRRLQMKEHKERKELEAEKKKKQLLELENRRKDLITRSRSTAMPSEPKDDQHLSLATKNYRARKAKSPTTAQHPHHSNATSPGRSRKTARKSSSSEPTNAGMPVTHFPLKDEAMADRRAEAEAELRTSYLLQEFESIVQREVNVLRNKGSDKLAASSANVGKADKGIETTLSLLQDSEDPSVGKLRIITKKIRANESIPSFSSDRDKLRTQACDKNRREEAATKIQAAFRAWRTRKYLREIRSSSHQESQRPTRISFYRARTPEVRTRRMPLIFPADSPVQSLTNFQALNSRPSDVEQRSAFGLTLDSVPYIPPPIAFLSPVSASSVPAPGRRLSTSSENIPPVPLHPVAVAGAKERRKSNRFEEPFPKEAVMRLNSPRQPTTPVNSDHYLRRDITSPIVNTVQIPGISDLLNPCIPTFSMVLQEKVKILLEKQKAAAERKSDKNLHQISEIKQKHLPDSYYDSDSTQHASIVLSSDVRKTSSSTDVTITDDYIGPDHEAMQLAYNLRKSPRLSLEADVAYCGTGQRVDVEMDNDSTLHSMYSATENSTGVETEEDVSYCQPDQRPRHDVNRNKPPSMSLTNFKLRVEENKNAVLEKAVHAYASLDEIRRVERTQDHQQQFNRNHNLEVEVGHLRKEVSAINETLRNNFVKTPDVGSQPAHHEHLVQLAKTQAESLKATVEVQQWLMELNSTSALEGRRQDTANFEAAISAVVELAKATQQVQVQHQQRLVLQGQGVQTTGSLLQKLENYSADEFLETSLEDLNIIDEELEEMEKITADELMLSEVSDYISESALKKSVAALSVVEPASCAESKEPFVAVNASAVHASSASDSVRTEETAHPEIVKTLDDDDSIKHTPVPEYSTLVEVEEEPTWGPSLAASDTNSESSPLKPIAVSSPSNKKGYSQEQKQEPIPDLSIPAIESDLISLSSRLESINAGEESESEKEQDLEPQERQNIMSDDSTFSEASDFITESSLSKSIAEDLVATDCLKETVEIVELSDATLLISHGAIASHDVGPSDAAEIKENGDVSSLLVHNSLQEVIEEESGLDQCFDTEVSQRSPVEDKDEELKTVVNEPRASEVAVSSEPSLEKSFTGDPAAESSIQNEKESTTEISSPESEAPGVLVASDIKVTEADRLEQAETKIDDSVSSQVLDSHLEEMEEAALDMIELHEYNKGKLGFPVRKPVKKWCVRRRDIADEVLVAELVEENRQWTDHRAEEAVVKDALVESMMRRAVREALRSVSQVIGK